MEEKVYNPISGKKITVGKKLYNDFIAEGYIREGDYLVKPSKKKKKEKISKKSKKKYITPSSSIEEEEEVEEFEPLESIRQIAKPIQFMPTFTPKRQDIEYEAFPNVQCPTCGSPKISMLNKKYQQLLEEGYTPYEAFNKLGIQRVCCRKEMQFPPQRPIEWYPNPYEYRKNIREKQIEQKVGKLTRNPLVVVAEPREREVVRIVEGEKNPTYYYDKEGNIKKYNPPLRQGWRERVIDKQGNVFYRPIQEKLLRRAPFGAAEKEFEIHY